MADNLPSFSAPPVPLSGFVLITGGASGIGLATARLLTVSGKPVALLDIDGEAVESAAAELGRDGARVIGLECDVSDEQRLEAAFRAAEDALGPVGGAVSSAGIDRGGELHELGAATWDEVIGVNLRGTFLTCRAALRSMLGRRGSIVCVSSPFALVVPGGGVGAYAASKGGISALVRAMAVDYARHGIRVNAVLPGPTETPLMWANVPPEEQSTVRGVIAGEVPLGRLADPSEPAQAVLWLLSDMASYVTGTQVACDGGLLAKSPVSV